MRAKVSGFMERAETVYRRYPISDNSLPARYARAIATYLHGDPRSAITQIDGLIKVEPANPYFYELKGQALLEGGRPTEAIAPFRKAVQLSHQAPLIEMLLGQALVASDNKAYANEAISILKAALAREPEAPIGYTQIAMAYGRKGDLADADLAAANAAYLRGDHKTARDLASLDDEGRIFIRGRSKLLIEVSGYKIDPIEIEETLMALPAVAEAAVAGLPDPRNGNRLVAFVVKEASISADEVLRYAREKLSVQKVPAEIAFIDSLPKSPTGKLLRARLREL